MQVVNRRLVGKDVVKDSTAQRTSPFQIRNNWVCLKRALVFHSEAIRVIETLAHIADKPVGHMFVQVASSS